MPTYQYRCTECGNNLEAVQKFTDPALTVCPACSGSLRKVFNAVGVVFKGSGFYRTDSRAAAGPNGSAGDSGSTDGKSDGKSEGNGQGSEKKSGDKSGDKNAEKNGEKTAAKGSSNAAPPVKSKQPAGAGSGSATASSTGSRG